MQTTATLSCRRQTWNNKLSGFQHFINVFAENTESCMIQCLRYQKSVSQMLGLVSASGFSVTRLIPVLRKPCRLSQLQTPSSLRIFEEVIYGRVRNFGRCTKGETKDFSQLEACQISPTLQPCNVTNVFDSLMSLGGIFRA